MTVTLGVGLAAAIGLLVALAVVADLLGRLNLARDHAVAAARAVGQLALVSLVITAAVQTLWGAFAVTIVMFAIAVRTTARRTGVTRAWPWTALAMAAGVLPVELVVFLTGAAPFTGIAIVALCGIIIGNAMTAHTLLGRRCFAELRGGRGSYEAALALGFVRRDAVGLVLEPVLPEALIPNLDQTRTVGLVTLPGAFIGVLLGGGSPLQAGAAQVLVLVGIMAAQALVVLVGAHLMRAVRLLPEDLKVSLHP